MRYLKLYENYGHTDYKEHRWNDIPEYDDIINIAKDVCQVRTSLNVKGTPKDDVLNIALCRNDATLNYEPLSLDMNIFCTNEEIKEAAMDVITRLENAGLDIKHDLYYSLKYRSSYGGSEKFYEFHARCTIFDTMDAILKDGIDQMGANLIDVNISKIEIQCR